MNTRKHIFGAASDALQSAIEAAQETAAECTTPEGQYVAAQIILKIKALKEAIEIAENR